MDLNSVGDYITKAKVAGVFCVMVAVITVFFHHFGLNIYTAGAFAGGSLIFVAGLLVDRWLGN